jgi:hypothetical protein
VVTIASCRIATACACLVVMVTLATISCRRASPTAPIGITLLDTTVTLAQGVSCNVGYVGADFQGMTGKTVAISAAGAGHMTPLFILYAPDFATRISQSSPSGAGAASLTVGLTQSGVHHLSICDVNGNGGVVRVTVTQD